MDMHEHRRKRLAALLQDHYDNDRKKFCDDSNLSESRLGQLLSPSYRGGQGFGEKAARRLEKRLGLNPLYFELLMLGETSAHLAYRQHANTATDADDMIFVRQVSLTIVPGAIYPDITELKHAQAVLCLQRKWLQSQDLLPENLLAITIEDASMLPRLACGDIAVINTASTIPKDNGIFLINCRGALVVRRITRDLGGWYLSADNPNRKYYQREQFQPEVCEVLGRVVFLAGAYL